MPKPKARNPSKDLKAYANGFTKSKEAAVSVLLDYWDNWVEENPCPDESNFSLEFKINMMVAMARQQGIYQAIDALYLSPDDMGHKAIMEMQARIDILKFTTCGNDKGLNAMGIRTHKIDKRDDGGK